MLERAQGDTVYIIEIDFHYPEETHKRNNDLPAGPETIKADKISPFNASHYVSGSDNFSDPIGLHICCVSLRLAEKCVSHFHSFSKCRFLLFHRHIAYHFVSFSVI